MTRPCRAVALMLAALFAVNGVVLCHTRRPALVTDDRNRDGRADVWRWYDADGRLVRLEIDTNFDGRPDRREEYRDNRLLRREIDRNFDDRLDDVFEFDPETSLIVLEKIDTNLNGTADLLRLYALGRPVFSERVDEDARVSAPGAAGGLQPFNDPFLSDLAVHPTDHGSHTLVAVLASAGLLPQQARVSAPCTNRAIQCHPAPRGRSDRRNSISLRGPPLASSL